MGLGCIDVKSSCNWDRRSHEKSDRLHDLSSGPPVNPVSVGRTPSCKHRLLSLEPIYLISVQCRGLRLEDVGLPEPETPWRNPPGPQSTPT